jgi:serine/threonine protein kinase
MASNPVLLKRFEQEFRAASRLDHPNIVRALDFGEDGDQPYLVMEFVEGESLGQMLEREGRMREKDAISVIAQVAQGLYRAHKQNIIHRDVKPDNILIATAGDELVAKLADLGLVKETETDLNLTKTGRGLGTPHFMAPEQFRNAKGADERCDIYSLGATLYQMVTGELPFVSKGPLDTWMKKINNELTPPRGLVPELSERIDWAILRAMSADPNQRPSTCREFVEDLTGKSTRKVTNQQTGSSQDIWYLVYKDECGAQHTVRGTTPGIRRSLKDGLLGDASNIRASRTKGSAFELLRSYPEFRDLLVAAAPLGAAASGGVVGPSRLLGETADSPATAASSSGRPNTRRMGSVERTPMPHISLDDRSGPAAGLLEWLKWLLLGALAMATAVAAFYFLRPK